ncbi:unnamed protein product [Phytophthora fragariaefolia]|uniref:Unnamed protein product n=1 Tax=Phytophthora fragariaefolia TaxID=1490495 RepID=A0A9W6XY28_9STRA|nr:unnamed protein product [Phytophthora fragariaefolia]
MPQGGLKRKLDVPTIARKRRRVLSGDGGTPATTASTLGGVAVIKEVWRALVKEGWTSKRPSTKTLDSRYKYILPGGKYDGVEGSDFLLGELAILEYVEALNVREVAGAQGTGKT